MKDNNQQINPKLWVELYGDMLYNYAFVRVNSDKTAEDLVQDTFIAGLQGIERFRGDSHEKTWLFAILKRKIIDYYRKASRKYEINENKWDSPFKSSGFFEGHWNTDKAPQEWNFTANGPLHQGEFQEVMAYCLSLLPDKWKSIFMMKVMEEMKTEEVCKEAKCTSSNLWVIIHRAKLKLRACIETNWMNES